MRSKRISKACFLRCANCLSKRKLAGMHFNLFFMAVVSILLFSCSKPGDSAVEQAVTAYRSGKYEQALELFNESLEKGTKYTPALIYTFISNTYAAQDDFENAAVYLEKSLEERPDYRGYVTLGMDYQTLKNYEKAEESYLKAIDMDGQKGEGWASLGMMYLEEGISLQKAVEYLEKGIEFSPKIAVIHAYLGVAYFKAGDEIKAEKEFTQAEELKCENLGQIKERFGIE